jgi:beta-galactosidase
MKYELRDYLFYGADYNPDQWLDYPAVIEEDFRMMRLAHTNAFSINIFGWSAIEKNERAYTFDWLDDIMDRMGKQGNKIFLSTPSGAKPAWMSEKYPEIRRVNSRREHELHGQRHNHCYTSPIYRKKVYEMNKMLAERYKDHPALFMWHVSNEYGGECHCSLCQEAFRNWLKEKYKTLDNLNKSWWTTFWSHIYTSWNQIESPSPIGESQIHALNLDWQRFVTHQTIDFYKNEIAPLKEITPDIPCTTNFMGGYPIQAPFWGLDYGKFAKELDVVSWDAYPEWHNPDESDYETACRTAFVSDLYRTLNENKPFILMECTPSAVNWQRVAKLKEPGLNMLSGVQSIAHGSNGVMYFQWRKSKGSSEKLHGAVVSQDGRDDTRVFKEAADLGQTLKNLSEVSTTSKNSKVAVIFDWENRWALADAQGYGSDSKKYEETVEAHYREFWKRGLEVDVVTYNEDLEKYDLIVGPMLYLLPDEMVSKIKAFVSKGGTFVTTYISDVVNDIDLVKGIDPVFESLTGVRVEEIDSLFDGDIVRFNYQGKAYQGNDYCESLHLVTAENQGIFADHIFSGQTAVTKNNYEDGTVYYMGVRGNDEFLSDFYGQLLSDLDIHCDLPYSPEGKISIQIRRDGDTVYYFLMNFSNEQTEYRAEELVGMLDVLSGKEVKDSTLNLSPYGFYVIKRN